MGEDGARGRVRVAVVGEIGLERAEQVGAVLAIVLDQGLDGVAVEAPDLLRARGERAEEQAVDAAPDPVLELVGEALVAGDDVERELGLADGAVEVGRVGAE